MAYETLIVETPSAGVTLIRLNRPQALNALNSELLAELSHALDEAEADNDVRCVVLTGSERAFAAGADIKEMSDKSYAEMFQSNFFGAAGQRLERFRKPIIAAVAGFALGGGCELAMLCDIIIAADTAKFGQPEINLGVMPGIGGTQRLPRAVGKAKAMDMVLTARMMDAAEAERAGLVSRVVPADKLIEEALGAAARIAGQSMLAVMMNKELVNAAFETTLSTGVTMERRLFHSLFAFEDQKEGMAAFIDKRKPDFKGR
ncbi:MAG: enoyl-CoA hydratase [Phenylobacterium sp.]|uniref:enoyl-CoA hydratase n=1 Tax=Phenylobacterium sp. TaxID=1871053 RepID=UPI001A395794|nr:enoyl-CoA hydratase [Phenylobacterium sp.]MBL8769773.1 enoyl-CoA hydratase [Phenylobacterium sp.]